MKFKKRITRYEEWDSKGGFNIKPTEAQSEFQAKVITDVSMAYVLGIEPGFSTTSQEHKKRHANASPMDPKDDWCFKHNKTSSQDMDVQAAATNEHENEDMELHFSLVISVA